MKKITIRKYGIRPLGDTKVVIDVMAAQNRLWNNLVEIDLAIGERWQNIVQESDAELLALSIQAKASEEAIEALKKERGKSRAAARRKKTESADTLSAAIKEQSALLKELRAKMKACKSRAREAAKPALESLELERRAKVKEAAAKADLWWCHSETVLNKYDVARVRAMKTGAKLRFHRFEGGGSVGVRFSPGLVMNGQVNTKLFNLREPTETEAGRKKLGSARRELFTASVRMGAKNEEGTFPIVDFLVTVHKGAELLLDAPLKTVTIKREMHAGIDRWFMVLMYVEEVEQEQKPLNPGVVGIDFGWRVVRGKDGETALRVATISRGDDVPIEYITLDAKWIRRIERAEQLRSNLDDSCNRFWERLRPIIDNHGLADDEYFAVLAAKAKRAKQPYVDLMLRLVHAHAQAGAPLGDDNNAWMQGWATRAKWDAVAVHGTRNNALDCRKHFYRNAAAKLVRECGMVAVKATNFSELSRLEKKSGEETELAELARRNRVLASPAELRQAIELAAKREQLEVVQVPPEFTTATCASCGHVHGGRFKDLMVVCDGCGSVWDIDDNSAHNCRKYALESGGCGI